MGSEGSAPLASISLVGPGFLGLNTQLASSTLGSEWALEARNCVFDDSNRLAARLGWSSQTPTPASGTPDFEQIFQYINLSGTSEIISAGGNKLWSGVSAPADKTGTVTVSANKWKFVNFNGNVYGLQSSHALIQYTGSGNFTNVTAASGTVPDGNELLGAFGHLWGTSANGQTLKYSALLDATNWTTGAGSFNFTNVWPTADSIVALAAFNNLLVVFGSNNILIMTDNTGSSLGMNPTNMVVQDVIAGTGCIARDSVQSINGDDIAFLSRNGLQSLQRVLLQKTNPLRDLSKNVRNYLLATVAQETATTIKSTFSPYYGFYILLLPSTGKRFVFDTKITIPEGTDISTATSGEAWRVTEWDGLAIKSLLTLNDGKTIYGGKAGKLFQYSNTYTDDGSTYTYRYTSGWLNVAEELKDRFKFLKRISHLLVATNGTTVTTGWAFDFTDVFSNANTLVVTGDSGAEYGIGEFGLANFGTAQSLASFETPGSGSGQFIKVFIQFPVNGNPFSLQQLQLHLKVGRIK